MSRLIQILVLMVLFNGWGLSQSYTFKVRHDHDPWGKCLGELTVSPSGIRFSSDEEEHSFNWNWLDIQSVDRISEL